MMLRHWFLALFTLLVAAACIAIPFIPLAIPPFDTVPASGGEPAMQVLPSSLGAPMPAGLQAGDRVYFADMTSDTRSLFMVGSLNPPAGETFDLPVRRADGIHKLQIQFVPVNFLSGSALNVANQLVGYALNLLMAALGLLLLWRGRSRATLGVAIWCFATFTQTIFTLLPLPLPYCKFLSWSGTILANVGTLIGLYLVADGMTSDARTPERRRISHWVFSTVVVLYLVSVLAYNARFYLFGNNVAQGINYVVGLHLAGFMISLAILLFNYRRSMPETQARMRWMLFSLLGLLFTYGFGLAASRLGFSPLVLNICGTVLIGGSFTGFAYAVLRHRLLSLEFVVNRALVYGLITSLVVGVFAALLAFLERTALNTETNRFLALLAPLLLGMGLNAIKRRVDEHINKMFFRRRYRAEAELTQLARTSGYVEDPEKLLDLAADELYRNSGAQGLAIYLTQKGKAGPKLVRKQGALEFPAKLSADDLALLRLKAGDAEVDLRGSFSGLGNDGYAYALALRGEVLGFIVCGPRPAEAYTPEERRLYTHVAQQVGVALHALRLQEQQRLLKDLAEGAFKSLPTARAKAKALISASPAG